MSSPIFENERIYDDTDEELNIIASKDKRAQWRHRRVGPSFLKFGRKVKYHGLDLNSWVDASRIETSDVA